MTSDAASDARALSGISETLLIPLACRARASRDKSFPSFFDPKAESICDELEIDVGRYGSDTPTMRGAVARGKWYDARSIAFIKTYPNAIVFSIGSGLNTMYERVSAHLGGNGAWHWVDSDLSDVIALRKKLFPDSAQRTNIQFNALEDNLRDLSAIDGTRPLLVISEAVLIYLEESSVRAVFSDLAERAKDNRTCHFLFDWCSPEMVARSARHPALKSLKHEPVVFKSALRRASDISRYHNAWQVLSETSVVMVRSGLGPAIFEFLFRLSTLGRRVYGLCEAKLVH